MFPLLVFLSQLTPISPLPTLPTCTNQWFLPNPGSWDTNHCFFGAGWAGVLNLTTMSDFSGIKISWRDLVHNPDCVDRVKVFVDNVSVVDTRDLQVSWITVEVPHLKCVPRTYSLKVQIFNKGQDQSVDTCYEAKTEEKIGYFNEEMTPEIETERDITGGRFYLFRKIFANAGSMECLDTVTIQTRHQPTEEWIQYKTLTGLSTQDYNYIQDIDWNQEFRLVYRFNNGDVKITQIKELALEEIKPRQAKNIKLTSPGNGSFTLITPADTDLVAAVNAPATAADNVATTVAGNASSNGVYNAATTVANDAVDTAAAAAHPTVTIIASSLGVAVAIIIFLVGFILRKRQSKEVDYSNVDRELNCEYGVYSSDGVIDYVVAEDRNDYYGM